MSDWVQAAKVTDVPDGRGITVDIQGTPVALFKVEGQFYAIDDVCPHSGGPLGNGHVSGSIVACPWHYWQFDIKTGKCEDDPYIEVATFPVRVENDDIYIKLG